MAVELSLTQLRELLHYDPETGVFTWAKARPRCRVGGRAGTLYTRGYRYIWFAGGRFLEHRLAWFYMTGEWPTGEIDHIDRDRSNNRFSNLRELTASENHFRIPSKKKYRGVSPRGERFRAVIGANGKTYHLGSFGTAGQAHQAYLEAAHQHFGRVSHELGGAHGR